MRLRIASYNVHGFVGNDGARDVPRIARVLRELGAHIVALQEVTFTEGALGLLEPVELLADLAGFRSVCSPILRGDGVHFGNVLLTSLPIERSEAVCLSFGRRERRTALDVHLEAGGHRLRVIATHLGLWPAERRFQVRRLLTMTKNDAADTTLMLGDFNEWFLAGRPLRWLGEQFAGGPGRATFPSRWPLLALDRIWVHPRKELIRSWVHHSEHSRKASDHLPVMAELQLSVAR